MSNQDIDKEKLNAKVPVRKEETPEELRARALDAIETGFRDKTTGRLDRDAIHDRKLAREILKIEQQRELESDRANES